MGDASAAKVFSAEQVLLPDISYKAFTYPGDEEALSTLRNIPGAAPLLTWLQANFAEQLIFLSNNEQMVRASRHNYASLYRLVERCCEILSCPVPELYIQTNPQLNAYTQGQRRTCIVLHSAIIEQLTADELSFVVGHEIGHIKCAHGLYRLLGEIVLQYWDTLAAGIPVPGLALLRMPLLSAYWEWYRRAEFTCDRAGLLCIQDPTASLRALGKLAGKVEGYDDEFDIDATIAQADAHREVGNKLVVLMSILQSSRNTHPFVPQRLRTLKEWAAGDAYPRILAGNYERDLLGIHEGGERIKCECGSILNSKLSFCPECGRSLHPEEEQDGPNVCLGCGETLPVDTKFCPKCGAKQAVSQEGVPPPPPLPGSIVVTPIAKLRNTATSFFRRS